MAIPVAAIWRDTMDFVRRESALLVPLALATLGLGDAAANVLAGILREAAPGPYPPGTGIGLVFAVVLSVLGQLAIMALALGPGGMSVGEALRTARARLLKLAVLSLMMVWAVVILLMPLLLMLASAGIDLSTPNPKIPPLASFYGFLISGAIIWAGLRLLPLNALLVDRNPAILEALREAFRITRGHAAILLAIGALYLLAWALISGLVGAIVSAIFIPASTALGIPFAGKVMVALGGGMVAAGLGMISAVFIAKLYRHLNEAAAKRA